MKIRKRIKLYGGPSKSHPSPKAEEFIRLDLQAIFGETRVAEVFLKQSLVKEIDLFAAKSLENPPLVEVGGFLLGKVLPFSPQTSSLYIEQFIPDAESEYNSRIRLDFGYQTILTLDRYLEQNPSLALVGWFHTHPGHGPYLSSIDLSTQHGFFSLTHMIAIVLDPTTDGFETGVYSWKNEGEMNNQFEDTPLVIWKNLLQIEKK